MLAFSPLFSDGLRAYAWRALTSIAQLRFAELCNVSMISFTAERRRERARPSTKDKSRQTFDIVSSPRTQTRAQKELTEPQHTLLCKPVFDAGANDER